MNNVIDHDETLVNYSGLRKAKRLPLADIVPIPAPFTIYIEPTNICNFRCSYCPESFADYPEQAGGLHSLGIEDFKLIAEQIEKIGGVKLINFYMMGEPFSNPNLCEFIKISKQKSLAEKVIVTTNASLLKEKYFEPLLNSGLDYLRISIYGGNQLKHAERTKSKVSLDKILSNIAGFKKLRDAANAEKPFIYLKMIDSSDDQENNQFLEMFSAVADEICIEPVMNWNDLDDRNLANKTPDELLASNYFDHRKTVCPSPFYTLIIHSDLNVSVCCVDWSKQTVIGNLREEPLKEVWQGQRLFDFRMAHLLGNRKSLEACRNCTFLFTMPDNLDTLSPQEFKKRFQNIKI